MQFVEFNVFDTVFDTTVDVDVATTFLDDVGVVWLENVVLSMLNIELVAACVVGGWTLDDGAWLFCLEVDQVDWW